MAKKQTNRTASIKRTTNETQISLSLKLNGTGKNKINTGVPFLDHMLDLFSKHGFFDLTVQATGDTEVDDHHTVEDVGICLGQALRDALGDKVGIRRFGTAHVPLDEAIASVTVDLSGRSFLVMKAKLGISKVGNFDPDLVYDFYQSFVTNAALTLHINVPYGRNVHHKIECIFKAFARALSDAVDYDPRQTGIPSTKGVL